jgi:hypothetical protein
LETNGTQLGSLTFNFPAKPHFKNNSHRRGLCGLVFHVDLVLMVKIQRSLRLKRKGFAHMHGDCPATKNRAGDLFLPPGIVSSALSGFHGRRLLTHIFKAHVPTSLPKLIWPMHNIHDCGSIFTLFALTCLVPSPPNETRPRPLTELKASRQRPSSRVLPSPFPQTLISAFNHVCSTLFGSKCTQSLYLLT